MELLVTMVLCLIIAGFAFSFFASQSGTMNESRQTSEMQQELRWAMTFVSDHLKLAGNGVPPTCGWPVLENGNGVAGAPDTLSVLGSFKSLVVNTTQTMGNTGSQVKCDSTEGVEAGDLVVISDGTFQEIFMITSKSESHLWHDTSPPWNDDQKLDHRYVENSSLTVVSHYSFFVSEDDDGRSNLMVQTQAYEPQILYGDIDDFQIRFKMKDNSWVDETDEISDIRMIEVTIRGKTPQPLKDYIDPVYGDAYKRKELKSIVIPKNLVIL